MYGLNISRGYRPVSVFDIFARDVDRLFANTTQNQCVTVAPDYDSRESDDGYLVSVDMPGLKKADIDIEVIDRHLVISGERKVESDNEQVNRLVRRSGKYYRSFLLPQDADPNAIEATYEDGVLTVALAKREESKPHKIVVGENESGLFKRLLTKKAE